MSMTIADIGLELLAARELADTDTRRLFADVTASALDWSLLQIAAGREWESPAAGLERWVLVLDGIATFHAAGHRHSTGTGQAVHVPGDSALRIHNDDQDVLRALVLTSTGLLPSPASEPTRVL